MKSRIVIIAFAVAAVLSLAAGLAGGMLLARLPQTASSGPTTSAIHDQSLRELNLSPAQQQQMRDIWEKVQKSAQDSYRDARRCESERDRKLEALLTDEQKKEFGKITQDYVAQYGAAKAHRDAIFREAVEETRKILNSGQRERYEQILKAKLGAPGEPTAMGQTTALSSDAR